MLTSLTPVGDKNMVTIQPFPLTKNNYLSRDYLTLRAELLQKLPIVTKGRWTDMNESDPGVTLLETYFSAVDNLMFYIDMQGQEIDLERAKQRVSVIKMLRVIGYEMNGISASRGTVTFRVAPTETPNYPVTVQRGCLLTAPGPGYEIQFTTKQPVSLIGPTDTKTVQVFQGIGNTEKFVSDGTQSQKISLAGPNIDKTTVEVYVDIDPANAPDDHLAESWSMVETFYESIYTSKVYKVQIDELSRVYVIFGDGQFGSIPPRNAQITISYIQTRGSAGNVGRNAIVKVASSAPIVVDASGNKVTLMVINSEATAGGDAPESIEKAKSTALGLLYGLRRAMSRQDYEALAKSVPGVTKAVAWGENEEQNPDYRLLNRVRVCFFAQQFIDMYYNPASRQSYRSLRDNLVRTLLIQRMPITTRLMFVDPVLQDIFVNISIGIDLNIYDPNLIIDQIRFNILNYYALDTVNFGQDIRVSTILSLTNAVEGVSWAKIKRLYTTPPSMTPDVAPNPVTDLVLEKWKIPVFEDTVISDVDLSAPTQTPPYIQFLTPLSFNLGQNDVMVQNPDEQSDTYQNGYTYYPGTNIQQHYFRQAG